ncbi:DUF4177 domain-containing protein [Paenibacillus fonticola]|uniref:DUF4177 domain-containing protein n=1 Tax=Paenibacillus fonticola TaxID=379896 RepID=UPI00036912DF|nr:DUF4177 domain-containing protein [Paenibacillus fonticola]
MLEYQFVEVPIGKSKKSLQKAEASYREIIRSKAGEGWRLVQIFTPVGDGLLVPDHYEIIFEKNVTADSI